MACTRPFSLRVSEFHYTNHQMRDNSYTISCKCGKCDGCLMDKRNEWTMRLSHEFAYYGSDHTHFVTLTFDEQHLPSYDLADCKPLFQKFAKRLRSYYDYNYGIRNIKICYSGEYGSDGGRPHFHAVIFGIPNGRTSERKVYRTNNLRNIGKLDVHDINIARCWRNGEISLGYASNQGFRYVADYSMKNAMMHLTREQYYKCHGRMKPFFQLGREIGKRYAMDNALNMYENLFINYQDRRMPIPKIYRKWCQSALEPGLDITDKIHENFYRRKTQEIESLYANNTHIRKLGLFDFHNFRDYYDLRNHDTLYKVVEERDKTRDRINKQKSQLWKDNRRAFSKLTALHLFDTRPPGRVAGVVGGSPPYEPDVNKYKPADEDAYLRTILADRLKYEKKKNKHKR